VPFLDCYHRGALLGDRFPVNSYGPASREDLARLNERVAHNFDRTEIVSETKGRNPLPPELWPGAERPR
jgi:hypothetical protein